jgi:hypothetical protein
MFQTTISLVVVFSVAQIALASHPVAVIRSPQSFPLFKREAPCPGPVICKRTEAECYACPEEIYACTPVGSGFVCCENGYPCEGPRCVDAGSRAVFPTQACPTQAPICTTIKGVVTCVGTIEDWYRISSSIFRTVTRSSTSSSTSLSTSSVTSYSTGSSSSTVTIPTITYPSTSISTSTLVSYSTAETTTEVPTYTSNLPPNSYSTAETTTEVPIYTYPTNTETPTYTYNPPNSYSTTETTYTYSPTIETPGYSDTPPATYSTAETIIEVPTNTVPTNVETPTYTYAPPTTYPVSNATTTIITPSIVTGSGTTIHFELSALVGVIAFTVFFFL